MKYWNFLKIRFIQNDPDASESQWGDANYLFQNSQNTLVQHEEVKGYRDHNYPNKCDILELQI